jgi:hypothetical protein
MDATKPTQTVNSDNQTGIKSSFSSEYLLLQTRKAGRLETAGFLIYHETPRLRDLSPAAVFVFTATLCVTTNPDKPG